MPRHIRAWKVRQAINHAVEMHKIGACPKCDGLARKDGQWCVACGATGRRDEYDRRQSV